LEASKAKLFSMQAGYLRANAKTANARAKCHWDNCKDSTGRPKPKASLFIKMFQGMPRSGIVSETFSGSFAKLSRDSVRKPFQFRSITDGLKNSSTETSRERCAPDGHRLMQMFTTLQ